MAGRTQKVCGLQRDVFVRFESHALACSCWEAEDSLVR